MNYDEYLRKVPKVELHCHFEGTVRPQTFADLAKKHGVELPTDDADKLYDYDSIYEFLKIFATAFEMFSSRFSGLALVSISFVPRPRQAISFFLASTISIASVPTTISRTRTSVVVLPQPPPQPQP